MTPVNQVSQTEHADVPPWHDQHFVGGHPALDFVNTRSHRLDALKKVSTWLVYQQLLSPTRSGELVSLVESNKSEAVLIKSLRGLRNQADNIFDTLADDQAVPARARAQVLSIAGREKIQIETVNHLGHQPCALSIEYINTKSVTALIAL